jgi:hypothetical protein
MADQTQSSTGLVIPPDVQEKFGALLALIQGSESMNNEERQYWINILPIMTPEQIQNLQEILTSEKSQLAAIDAKYSKEGAAIDNAAVVASMEQKIKDKKLKRKQKEDEHDVQEKSKEDELLAQIQSF